jgi:hypothetical protein
LAKSSTEQDIWSELQLDLSFPKVEGAPDQEVSEPQVQLLELPAEAAAELRQMAPPQPSPSYEYGYALTRKQRDGSSVADVYGVALGKPSKEVEIAILQALLHAGFNQFDKSQQSPSATDVFVYVWCSQAEALNDSFDDSVKKLLNKFFRNLPDEEEVDGFFLTIRGRIAWELQIAISLIEKKGDAAIVPIRLTKQWGLWDALAFLQDALTMEGGSPNYDANSPRDPLDFARDLQKFLFTPLRRYNNYLPSYVYVSFALRNTPAEPPEVRQQGIRQACKETLQALLAAPLDVGVGRTDGLSGIKGINAFLTYDVPLCHHDGVSELEKSKKILPLSQAKLPKMPRGQPKKERTMKLETVKVEASTLQEKLYTLKEQMLVEFQMWLDKLHQMGACPSTAQNEELVNLVMKMADDNGFTLLCRDNKDGKLKAIRLFLEDPKSPTGIIRARVAGGKPTGGGALFPQLIASLGHFEQEKAANIP